jgi:hypothetical protein
MCYFCYTHKAYSVVGLRNFIYAVSILFHSGSSSLFLICSGNLHEFYRILNSIALLTRSRLMFISLDKLILPTQFHSIYLRSFLILPFHLCLSLPLCFISADFLTETLYAFFSPPYVLHPAACHSS